MMEAMGFSLGGGGRDAAGDSEGNDSESGNPGLDRHGILHPVENGPLWAACADWTEAPLIGFVWTCVNFS
jgi:hypothetical protein